MSKMESLLVLVDCTRREVHYYFYPIFLKKYMKTSCAIYRKTKLFFKDENTVHAKGFLDGEEGFGFEHEET